MYRVGRVFVTRSCVGLVCWHLLALLAIGSVVVDGVDDEVPTSRAFLASVETKRLERKDSDNSR